ncbi:MAG: adenosylmethionine--8-amino-7-oxononanoate transaminase [Aeromonas sp.]
MNNQQFDSDHIWHPYASLADAQPCYQVVNAQGVTMTLSDGHQLIDGMGTWGAAIHGYQVPTLDAAAIGQLANMSHVMFDGLTHTPAMDLCRTLVDITPVGLDRVFLADSGSAAMDLALTLATQFWSAKGVAKSQFVTLRAHQSAAYPTSEPSLEPADTQPISQVTPNYVVDAPRCRFHAQWDDQCVVDLAMLIADHHQEIAAIVLEPIVQTNGAMHFYHPRYLQWVRALCDDFGVLLIADERTTGFGRTGQLFGCNWGGISPDILCLGKALTGGYLSLGATLTTSHITRTIGDRTRSLTDDPTFMGNPLACAVANASLAQLLVSPWATQVQAIEHQLKTELVALTQHPAVADVRVLGAIGVVEMHAPIDIPRFKRKCVELGAWITPCGTLIYLMPAFVISPNELHILTRAINQIITEDK